MSKFNKKNKMSSNRSFGLVFFLVFFIFAFWSFRGEFHQIKIIPLSISIFFLILGLRNSNLLTPINKLWLKLGNTIGLVVAPIVMGIVFFIVITPIGLIMRLIGKDFLMKKYSNKKSYWIHREKNIGSMKRQF